MIPLLLDRGATLTVCGSKTGEMDKLCHSAIAKVIISCVGKYGVVSDNVILNGDTVVIDCGIDFREEKTIDDNGNEVIKKKQFGDCDVSVYERCENVTPRIGGMGLMTRASLLQNVLEACKGEI